MGYGHRSSGFGYGQQRRRCSGRKSVIKSNKQIALEEQRAIREKQAIFERMREANTKLLKEDPSLSAVLVTDERIESKKKEAITEIRNKYDRIRTLAKQGRIYEKEGI